jgi:hypothetical protein
VSGREVIGRGLEEEGVKRGLEGWLVESLESREVSHHEVSSRVRAGVLNTVSELLLALDAYCSWYRTAAPKIGGDQDRSKMG